MRFTGHERDYNVTTGTTDDLDYMHARHYSPHLGRFFSFDPVGGNPRVPQSWNRYAYVMGRPLVYTDPEGLSAYAGMAQSMNLAWAHAFSVADFITVTAQADPILVYNPLTGLAGLNSLVSGSGFIHSLSSLSDLAVLRPSDFSIGRTAQVSGMGLAAFTDGVIPFADPFEGAGVYDAGELGLEHSQKIGEVTRDLEIALASTGSNALFGGGTWANKGQFLRFGHSFKEGKTFFAIRGKWIDKLARRADKHVYFWIIRNGR